MPHGVEWSRPTTGVGSHVSPLEFPFMSRHRSHRPPDTEEPHVPRWPVVVGAVALLLAVVIGSYAGGIVFGQSEHDLEEERPEVASGILVEPPGVPEETPEEPEEDEEEALPAGIDPEVTYVLQNVEGDRVLDVAGGATENGAHVHLWDRHDEENQQWRFVPVDDGHVEIVGVGSDKVLEIPGDPEAGPGAALLTRTGSPNQQWLVVEVGDGVVRLINRESSQVLEGEDGEGENGTLVIQGQDDGDPHQQWRLLPLG